MWGGYLTPNENIHVYYLHLSHYQAGRGNWRAKAPIGYGTISIDKPWSSLAVPQKQTTLGTADNFGTPREKMRQNAYLSKFWSVPLKAY